jgi:hypothetical protein
MDTKKDRPGNYLSIGMASYPSQRRTQAANQILSDGGVNPLSALYIIDEMMSRLKFDIESEEDLLVGDWFDLIIGSGHGG